MCNIKGEVATGKLPRPLLEMQLNFGPSSSVGLIQLHKANHATRANFNLYAKSMHSRGKRSGVREGRGIGEVRGVKGEGGRRVAEWQEWGRAGMQALHCHVLAHSGA